MGKPRFQHSALSICTVVSVAALSSGSALSTRGTAHPLDCVPAAARPCLTRLSGRRSVGWARGPLVFFQFLGQSMPEGSLGCAIV